MSAALLSSLVRVLTTSAVVLLASGLAEAIGPFWGALILSLPVTAGPTYVFMALERDAGFVSGAALSGFAGNAAAGIFLIIYARLAPGAGLARALGTACLAWLAAALPIAAATWTVPRAFFLNALIYGLGVVLYRSRGRIVFVRSTPVPRRRLDLAVRASIVALFVTGILAVSNALGPERTGVAAAFPVAITCTLAILHARAGGAATAQLAIAAIKAMFGVGLMLMTVHLLAQRLSVGIALLAALAVSLLWSALLLALQRRQA